MLEEEFVKLMRQIIGGTLFESSFQIPNIFLLRPNSPANLTDPLNLTDGSTVHLGLRFFTLPLINGRPIHSPACLTFLPSSI